jgi:hypothetical protein
MTMLDRKKALQKIHDADLDALKKLIAAWDTSEPHVLDCALCKLENHLCDEVTLNKTLAINNSKEFAKAQNELMAKAKALAVEMDCGRGADLLWALRFLQGEVDHFLCDLEWNSINKKSA